MGLDALGVFAQQPEQIVAVLLRPVGDDRLHGGPAPLRVLPNPGPAQLGRHQDRRPAVGGVRATLDQTRLDQRGDLPGHRRRIGAHLLGQIAGPARAEVRQLDQQVQRRMVTLRPVVTRDLMALNCRTMSITAEAIDSAESVSPGSASGPSTGTARDPALRQRAGLSI